MSLSELRFAGSGEPILPESQKWFTFATQDGSFRVLINRFRPDDWTRLEDSWMRLDKDNVRRPDPALRIRALARDVVADLDGIVDQAGAKVEATQDVKELLLRELAQFRLFVMVRFWDDDWFRKNEPSGRGLLGTGALPALEAPQSALSATTS